MHYVEDANRTDIKWGAPQGALKEPRSYYDMGLALRGAVETIITGRMPSPEEAAQKNLLWLSAVNLQIEWIKHYEGQQAEEPDGSNGRG